MASPTYNITRHAGLPDSEQIKMASASQYLILKYSYTYFLTDNYYSCGGFTYNITRHAGPPDSEQIKMASASQWSVLSRHLVEDLLDRKKHKVSPNLKAWKKYNFFVVRLL